MGTVWSVAAVRPTESSHHAAAGPSLTGGLSHFRQVATTHHSATINHQQECLTLSTIETDRELVTVLAALRYWQREGLMSAGAETELASDGGKLVPLTAREIDGLCERLNFAEREPEPQDEPWGEQLARQLEDRTEPPQQQLFAFAPTGCEIIGTLERLSGCAGIVHGSYRRTDTGGIGFDWEGGTEIFWDCQQTETIDGAKLFLDGDGDHWTEDELILLDHDQPTDYERDHLFTKPAAATSDETSAGLEAPKVLQQRRE